MDYRGLQEDGHALLYNSGAVVERVRSIKFLFVYFSNDLTWSRHTKTDEMCSSVTLLSVEAQEVWSPLKILTNFYKFTIDSIMHDCLVWLNSLLATSSQSYRTSPIHNV